MLNGTTECCLLKYEIFMGFRNYKFGCITGSGPGFGYLVATGVSHTKSGLVFSGGALPALIALRSALA